MNNAMFGPLIPGAREIILILMLVFVMAVVAGGLIVLAVYLTRRSSRGTPAVAVPTPPRHAPPLQTCPRCNAALPPGAPQGLCPRCVMGVGLAIHTEATDECGPHGTKRVQPPLAPADLASHFPQLEILECLGRGGMGVVYKARQPQLNRLVALKILAPEKGADPKFAERFLREAQALARLSHPNIVTVHDFGEADGLYYLLMEYVDGATLRRLLQTRKIAPEEALSIVPKICEALQYAHEQGVVHRDIKPENVLLDKRGGVKIADFGIAKIVGAEGTADSPVPADVAGAKGVAPGVARSPVALTQDQVLGTPHYMAPEQVEHPQDVDHRADIYSLGVVFYEMLTGELPLGRFQPPSRKVQLDVRLDEVVLHALEKEPERRYQHAGEVKTDVEAIAATPPGSSGREQAPTGIPKMEGRKADEDQSRLAPAGTRQESRLARAAIWGAIWAPLFFIAGVLLLFTYRVVMPLPHVLRIAPGILPSVLLPFGLTAPFGTTVLGWIAVAQIRRSAGRLYGLGLAVCDGLLFPLLALDGLICGMWLVAVRVVAHSVHPSGWPWAGRSSEHLLIALWVLVTLATSAVVDFLIIRLVWRNVKQSTAAGLPGASGATTPSLGGIDQSESKKPAWNWLKRASVAVGIGAVLLLVVGQFVRQPSRATPDPTNPFELRKLLTAEVIAAGLAKPDLPWAWEELQGRAKAGRLSGAEADTILDGLVIWLQRDYPNGYAQPLNWLGHLLDELARRKLVSDTQAVRFLQAFHGNPMLGPLKRLREGERTLDLHCTLHNTWVRELLGMVMLNELRSVTIDGEPIPLPKGIARSWGGWVSSGDLQLPDLAPGKHILRCEFESALVLASDLPGLPENAPSTDWPPAKQRWTRFAEGSLQVFAENAPMVGLTQEPALDPVTIGGLSVKQVIIRRKGEGATAVILFAVTDKLSVPIGFDVTLRLAGESIPCGSLFNGKPDAHSGTSSLREVSAEVSLPNPQVTEADIILTPNVKLIERDPSVDQVWGKDILFDHVPLSRQDLAAGPEKY